MHKLFATNDNRPLKMVFDINTNMLIGEVYKCFIWDVGSYMRRDIGFDKDTWTDVSEAERVGMLQYLSDVDVNVFLQTPTFVMTIGDIIRSFKNQINDEENNDGEDEDEDI
ncbi:unnamed protein product [Lactuca saligna]|uniref:Uncharacterized protein n=1 Tax=Lactuca saligna TaxID=75948 RepID=A0AA35ZPU3_LACSI|nr:unnamed protein product [Lactuca saligna]